MDSLNPELSHLDEKGLPKMVDVSAKPQTDRTAEAEAVVIFPEDAWTKLAGNGFTTKKGALFEVAITAALMASILLIVQRSSSRVMIALWVGGTVALLAFIAGPLTGASMNPARTLGPNLLNGMWATLPFYLASTTLGAWLACDIKHQFFPDRSSTD